MSPQNVSNEINFILIFKCSNIAATPAAYILESWNHPLNPSPLNPPLKLASELHWPVGCPYLLLKCGSARLQLSEKRLWQLFVSTFFYKLPF